MMTRRRFWNSIIMLLVVVCWSRERERGVLHKQIYIRQRMIMRKSKKIESELKQVARLLCWLQSIAAAAAANGKRMKSANCDEGSWMSNEVLKFHSSNPFKHVSDGWLNIESECGLALIAWRNEEVRRETQERSRNFNNRLLENCWHKIKFNHVNHALIVDVRTFFLVPHMLLCCV